MTEKLKTIVDKADLALSDLTSAGKLNTMQANTFIRMLIDQPTIVNEIRTVPMNSPTMEINKIGFASRILHPAPASGTALDSTLRSKPATEKVSLETKEIIAEVHIPYDVLEDNIERGSLEDTIMSLIAERASLDIEELVILGDSESGDAYLALREGILKQATSHVVDYPALVDISRAPFKEAVKAMPNKYMRNRAALRHYISPNVDVEFAESLAARETPMGDRKVTGWAPNYAFGIPLKPAALMPDASAILTYPKNIILGVQRSIMIETDRDIRARNLVVVLTMRLDVKFEEEDAVVKLTGLNPNGLTTTSSV